MKRILRLIVLAVLASVVSLSFPTSVKAQDADLMRQAIEGYRNLSSMTAKVTKRVHNEMVTKDITTTGTFYFKKPAKVCITTNGGKDKLVTDGQTFTIVQDGKASSASGKGNSALTPLVNAIKGITTGQNNVDLSDVADVDMDRQGTLMIMTVTPITKSAAERKKMMYQSFVITFDQAKGELRSIRLNGKGKNYDLYEFSNFQLNAQVDDSVFNVK